MATQPLSDDVLNDTSGFPDSVTEPAKEVSKEADDTLELTDDQALDDSLAQTDEGGETGEDGQEKPENPVEKRIKGALKARDEARNALEQEKAAKAELERRLAAIEAKMSPAEQDDAPEVAEAPPKPEDYELGFLDEKYQADAIDYRAKQAVKEALGAIESQYQTQQQAQAQEAEYQQQIDAAKNIVAKGVALYDDYEEVVWERGLREEYKLSKTTFDAIQEATHPAEIAYQLASDPAEAERVYGMSPIQQVKYVLEKDAELAGKTARIPKAGAPPGRPVNGSTGRFTVAPDTDDLDAFEKEFFKKKR